MAVNLHSPGPLHPVGGIRIGAVDAGIRKSAGEDLVVFELPVGASIAGVFTQNRARAAPVEVAIDHLETHGARNPGARRALVVNSGNANAGLGRQGIEDCLTVCHLVATELGITVSDVIPFSTGVIGERMPLDRFSAHVGDCIAQLAEDHWPVAAKAIMTTDTIEKAVSEQLELDNGEQVTITGIAKGSGMIEPNMATMLAFIATDAKVSQDYLQTVLKNTVEQSFNCITVDGDTSTNDACLLVATGSSGIEIDANTPASQKQLFEQAIESVAVKLAQAIVRDGEGATKFISIHVTGGKTNSECTHVAKTVANSMLVKTAMHASDPNWGRIYAAVGRAGVESLDRLSIQINDVEVMSQGAISPNYKESEAALAMKEAEFSITIDLGFGGECSAVTWTTDLSYEYVRINAEYRS